MSNPDDASHLRVLETLDQLHGTLLSTWPVIAQAAWLLKKRPLAVQEMLFGFASGIFKVRELREDSLPWICRFSKNMKTFERKLLTRP